MNANWESDKLDSKTGDPAVGSTRLLGCPWCGEQPEVWMPPAARTLVYVGCRNPMCACNPSVNGVGELMAKTRWNRRHPNK